MTITAMLTLEAQTFIARLSDGRELREADLDALAGQLFGLGLNADDVQTLDWRKGEAALMRGQIIAIKEWMRKRQGQEQVCGNVKVGRKT